MYHRTVDPHHQDRVRKHDDQNYRQKHLRHHGLDLRKKSVYIGYNEHTALSLIRVKEIHLLDQMLRIPIQIDGSVNAAVHVFILGQLIEELLGHMTVSVKYDLVVFSHNHICIFIRQLFIQLLHIFHITKLLRAAV